MPQLNKDDYVLTFLVRGVSVFVTDIHVDVYRELEVLFLINDGVFKQYFTRSAYEQALNQGLIFYKDKNAFIDYKRALIQHCKQFDTFFSKKVENKKKLTKEIVKTFFTYTIKLCKEYTKMNVEFTDKAFSQQEDDPIIKKNLSDASKFKDEIRTIMNKVMFEPDGYTSLLFIILGQQFKLQPYVLQNLTQAEILHLFDGKLPNMSSIASRQNEFVINFDRSHLYHGEAAQAVIDQFSDLVAEMTTVTGKIAHAGIAKGPVKLINVDYSDIALLNAEIKKMHKGDILVAQTTAPELIIACKKAAAIVTDIGGLLSHAAIVSREFGIPCIVGTEYATQIFKDGDVVEVDAEKGVVRKI